MHPLFKGLISFAIAILIVTCILASWQIQIDDPTVRKIIGYLVLGAITICLTWVVYIGWKK